MGISWGALAGAFLAPSFSDSTGVASLLLLSGHVSSGGVGFTVINMMLNNAIANPINCGAIAMVGGFPVVILVSLFTKKLNKARVDKIFECYKK
jgi:SSS family solute:Na+ symporter